MGFVVGGMGFVVGEWVGRILTAYDIMRYEGALYVLPVVPF